MPRQLYQVVKEGVFNPITGKLEGRRVKKAKHTVGAAVDAAIKELGQSNDFWAAIERLLKGSAKKAVADVVRRAEEILDGPVSDTYVKLQLFANDEDFGPHARWSKAVLEAKRIAVAKAHKAIGTQSSRFTLSQKAQEILLNEFSLDENFEMTDEFCGAERSKIRKAAGLRYDCRKYGEEGQPARDMVKKAA